MAKGGKRLEMLILELSSRRARALPGHGRSGLARTMLHAHTRCHSCYSRDKVGKVEGKQSLST